MKKTYMVQWSAFSAHAEDEEQLDKYVQRLLDVGIQLQEIVIYALIDPASAKKSGS